MGQLFQFHEVNAFTQIGMPAIGNPASICLVHAFPDDKIMEEAARQTGSPMTSFVCYSDDPHVFDIRHFSPADGDENHVCGHATIAAAEYLARVHPTFRQGTDITFRLNPKYGINDDNAFKVFIDGDDISLTMPAITELQRVDDPAFYRLLCDALNINESDIEQPAYYAPRIINYVVAFKDPTVFLAMSPDFGKLKVLAASKEFAHEGIMATVKSDRPDYDIFTRVFLPIIGVDEDVACGSANCSVVPYWAMLRQDVFAQGKGTFKAMFPYPPEMPNGKIGGVQHLSVDLQSEEVVLTGQASYQKTTSLNLGPETGFEPQYFGLG